MKRSLGLVTHNTPHTIYHGCNLKKKKKKLTYIYLKIIIEFQSKPFELNCKVLASTK